MTSIEDIIDDQIEAPKQTILLSPSSSHASLSKKIINNYKSQSLQSMNVLMNSGSINRETKHKCSSFKSSEHLNQRISLNGSKKLENFSINLVTSEEELDDEQENNVHDKNEIEISDHVEVVKSSEDCVIVAKFGFENHVEQINNVIQKSVEKKEKTRCSDSNRNYEDSEDDCTPSNSYHNSSESNISNASYASLHNVNTESANKPSVLKIVKSTKESSIEAFRDENAAAEQTDTVTYDTKTLKLNDDDYETPATIPIQTTDQKSTNSNCENDSNSDLKNHLGLLKYELKEKDLDIVQLQKEINELQLDNKMLKARIPLSSLAEEVFEDEEEQQKNEDNRYFQECRVLRREKEAALEELQRAQDQISRLKIDKNAKSGDLYESNNPEMLNKKIKHYEKRMKELEDQNEKNVNELSKLQKNITFFKSENNELKASANEARAYKEREDGMILEIANLKNEINKCVFANNQLNEENQRLMKEAELRPSMDQGISVGIQTVPVQHNDYLNIQVYDENEALGRKLQQQQVLIQQQQQQQQLLQQHHHQHHPQQHSHQNQQQQSIPYQHHQQKAQYQQQQQLLSIGRNSSQTVNSYDYSYYNQNQTSSAQPVNNNPYHNYSKRDSNNQNFENKQAINHQFEHESSETNNSYLNYRHSDKVLSNHALNDHHNTGASITLSRDSRRGSTHSTNTYNYNQNPLNETIPNPYRDGYSLSRNDDYLINNFRPFATSGNNPYSSRQNSVYQQPTMSTTSSSSRAFPTQSSTYPNTLSQRSSHSIHNTSNGYIQGPSANTGSSAYNTLSLQRQRELDTSNSPFITKLNDRGPTLSTSSSGNSRGMNNSRYGNILGSSYSRSNSIVNVNNSSNYKGQNDYNSSSTLNSRHDDPHETFHSNRRDSNDIDNEYDFSSRSYYRSKSADRTSFERKNLKTYTDKEDLSLKSSIAQDHLARKRPFVPLKPEDIRPGNYIKFSRPGGKISKGSVKYIGPLPERSDVYFGLELDSEEGKHDGIYQDKRYFQTKPNKGVFVSFSKVVMAWG